MSQYGERNSSSNTLRLKVDVHQIFDCKPRFAIVPKENDLVAHIFHATAGTAEAVQLYHNVPLQSVKHVRIECLLARMAWTIFPYLEIFLSAGKRRRVSTIGDDGIRLEEEVDGEKCYQMYLWSRARSTSARKRQIGQVNQEALNDRDELQDDDASNDDSDEWKHRGRKRRRASYTSCTPSSGYADAYRSMSEISESGDAALLVSLQT